MEPDSSIHQALSLLLKLALMKKTQRLDLHPVVSFTRALGLFAAPTISVPFHASWC